MSPERWRKISELFEAALDRPVDQRAAFLEHACAGEQEVQRVVEAMLAADERQGLLMDRPAYKAVGTFVPSMVSQADSQSFSGEMVGDYRLISELGRGGMGTVYLAYDTRLGRQAALKLLPSQFNSPERVRRLEREARAASALNHPHIITIYDFGRANDRDFIASEFVEGRTLRDYVGTSDLTLNKILEIAIQVTSALETAHTAGIIHRDIKPENIMLRPDGYAKVLDFGLAKLTETEFGRVETMANDSATSLFETRTGVLLGTIKYMSPEQVRGQKLDGRSDLFSLGVVLYELITGHRPFGGETWHHTMVAITDVEPPPIARDVQNAPAGLQEIINRVLAKNRGQRYQTARELLSDLEKVQGELAPNSRVERIGTEPAEAARISQLTTVIAGRVSDFTDRDTKDTAAGAVTPTLLKRHRRTVIIALVILATIAACLYFGRGLRSRPPAISDKDTILLADFVNTTGDTDFDGTLKQGLTGQLGQSPYVNIFPEERARETLGLMERSRDEKITREVGREIC